MLPPTTTAAMVKTRDEGMFPEAARRATILPGAAQRHAVRILRMRVFLALVCVAALLAPTVEARASLPRWSDYEKETVAAVLGAGSQGRIDREPDGKIIEEIDVVPLDVFDERDPVPDFFNIFHVTTRRRIVRRELLFGVGQRYDQQRADESARNLRALKQLSLVLVVPVRGSKPDRVRVVVITRDVWSLRLNSNFGYAAGTLTFLVVQPAEINLFGTHTTIGALFYMRPDIYSLGGLFLDPRVAGSWIQGGISGNVIVNRDSGRAEGSFGSFSFGQPLYSIDARWAWRTQVVWRTEITRYYIGGNPRTYDSPATPADDAIPYTYSSDQWFGAYELTRSFGHELKHDVSVGVEALRQRYHAEALSGVDPAAALDFSRSQVPVSDTRISPYVQLDDHTSRFLRVHDFNTLGLQEDYRLGHELIARLYPASTAVGSTRNLLGTYLAASYTAALGDGLARVLAASTVEFASAENTDALFEAGTRLVSPRFGIGRLVYDAQLASHYKNYLNQRYTIGGNTRLRGYPADRFLGEDLLAGTLEFRSRPAEILSAQLGGAIFYDVGDAFDGFAKLRPKQDAGFGVRILFPQADRIVFRADWGFPLSPGFKSFPGSIYLTLGQAFPMPAVLPPTTTHKRSDLDQ